MKKNLSIFFVLVLSFIILPSISHASTTGYAWSENTGWIDFASTTVSDTRLTGYAYGENIGWINFTDSIVTNTNGILSGYAWSENTGWIDFSSTTINTSTGVFTGYAYGENIGWINFTDTIVTTSWRASIVTPSVTVTPSSSSGSRVSPAYLATLLVPSATTTSTSSLNIKIMKYTFTRNLTINSVGLDVKILQQYLNSKGFTIANTDSGSRGNETTYFGALTRAALARFQKANNISPPIGYFGPITKTFINNHQ